MFGGRRAAEERGMRSERPLCQVFSFVVVMHGMHGRSTLPVTVCARPSDAEQAARVIAWLELSVLGGSLDDTDLLE
jgi:hypothetical protein